MTDFTRFGDDIRRVVPDDPSPERRWKCWPRAKCGHREERLLRERAFLIEELAKRTSYFQPQHRKLANIEKWIRQKLGPEEDGS